MKNVVVTVVTTVGLVLSGCVDEADHHSGACGNPTCVRRVAEREHRDAKLFVKTDDWNALVGRLSDEKAVLKGEITQLEDLIDLQLDAADSAKVWHSAQIVKLTKQMAYQESRIWKLMQEPNLPDPTPTPTEPNFTDQVQESLKGVVYIECPGRQGSGFVIAPDMIQTARHCVEGVEDFLIITSEEHKLQATRAISDKEHDTATIKIDDHECVNRDLDHKVKYGGKHDVALTPLNIGPIKDVKLGQSVYVIGSPYGKINFNSLTTGIISGVNRDWNSLGDGYGWGVAFTTTSPGAPGNSGGPVFTLDGVVRGILVGGFSPVLISVMPCDLFLADLDPIRLMFTTDRYRREEVVEYDKYGGYDARREQWGLER